MTSVFDIAKYILEKYESLPNMKLQKLVYYSQAWANGPVVEELYELLKGKFENAAQNILRQGLRELGMAI